MGRAPCCDKANVKKGPWSPEEDAKLKEFMDKFGTGGNWIALPQKAGLKRCGKSCRLRWLNYLRPNIKHGEFSDEEDKLICTLYATIGSRWSIIAGQLPGRTDNDIKNYWNTKLKKKLMGVIPSNTFQTQYHHSLSTLSQLYYQASKSLSTFEPNMYTPQNFHLPNNETFALSNYTSQYNPQMDLQNYYGKNNNMLMFGGVNEAASCSSSDGSCSQVSYGKDPVKREAMGCGNFQGFIPNGFDYGKSDPLMMMNGFVGEEQLQLECDVEEIKLLIGNGGSCNSLLLNDDENKTEMYYY